MAKPTVPKGTRDFLPLETRRRNHIFNTIKTVFEKYGYAPIETPAMENLSTLTGKYGEEGDRLIFKILNSGDFTKEILNNLGDLKAMSDDSTEELHREIVDKIFEVLSAKLPEYLKSELGLDEVKSELIGLFENIEINNHIKTDIKESALANGIYRLDYLITLELLFVQHSSDKDDRPISLFEEWRNRLNNEDISQIPITSEEYLKGPLGLSYFESYVLGALSKGIISTVDLLRSHNINSYLTEKALRYDLTVPFARYVVNHYNDLSFPFKRYQIQPVWRADRPQKGRYREFYQCDADVVGSDSLLNEVEMIQLFDEVLSTLGLEDFTIKINNRKILTGIAEVAGVAEQITNVTVALDKLDKIGADGVKKEWRDRGIPESAMKTLEPLLTMQGGNDELLTALDKMLAHSEAGRKGIAELREVLAHIAELGLNKAWLQVDVTLARGLDYYTGAIFEVLAGGVQMGSICGGGRYDDLTSIFGMDNLSGVGISFGADRIYDVLLELGKFPEEVAAGTKVLFVNFGEKESRFALQQIKALRAAGISCELYPDNAKMKKQMKFANDKNVQYVALAGENEIAAGKVNLKNMESGEQQEVEVHSLINHLK